LAILTKTSLFKSLTSTVKFFCYKYEFKMAC
jgi:hypothetical protein